MSGSAGERRSTSQRNGRSDTDDARPPKKIEMPRIEPPPQVEFDMEGSAGWLKNMDRRKAEFICTIEWSWSPVNDRMESYYLQPARTHWMLWLKRYDDNWGKWEKPIAIARCPRKGLDDPKDATMILLAAALAEGRRVYDPALDRFHSITGTGLLSIGELDAVADAVWGE
jgi:hypothetical protein